jgi:hypothetical protein
MPVHPTTSVRIPCGQPTKAGYSRTSRCGLRCLGGRTWQSGAPADPLPGRPQTIVMRAHMGRSHETVPGLDRSTDGHRDDVSSTSKVTASIPMRTPWYRLVSSSHRSAATGRPTARQT